MLQLRHAAALAVLIPTLAGSVLAQEVDLRDCPLDRLTFIDVETGDLFEVDTVLQTAFLVCGSGVVLAHNLKEPSADCRGPFGDTILEGVLREDDHERPVANVWAVWSVLPAAPCCDWSFDTVANQSLALSEGLPMRDGGDLFDVATRFDQSNMPTLAGIGAALFIPRDIGPIRTGTNLIPMICAAG